MQSYQTDYPVLDLNNQFVGVLTRTQLVRALKEQGAEADMADVMLPAGQLPICGSETTLADVWELMAQQGTHLVVHDE